MKALRSLARRFTINRLRLSNYLSYPLVSPITMTFTVTKRCNSRCSYCFDWGNTNPPPDPPREKIREILASGKRMGVKLAVFTGGEPLLRKDLDSLIRDAKDLGLETLTVTNGILLTRERARGLAEAGLDTFLLSLDTLDPAHYRANRGVDFALAERALKNLDAVMKEYPGRHAGVNCVITRRNLDDIRPLVEEMHRRRLHVCFDPYHEIVDHNVAGLTMEFSDGELVKLREVVAWLIDFREKYGTVASHPDYLRFIPDYFAGRKHHLRCMAGFLNINLSVALELKPCWLLPPVANLYETPLERAWRSPRMRAARRRIRKLDCPRCWLSCHITDSLNARGSFPGEAA